MKSKFVIPMCSLLALLTSCSTLGIYTRGHVKSAEQRAIQRGIQQGRSIEARASLIRDQDELEKPQPESNYYEIPVPAYTTADGVNIEQHDRTVEIITQ